MGQCSGGSILASSISSALGAAIVEELIFRGLMFQTINKLAGHWLALAVTSLFFGVVHLVNTGATLWSGWLKNLIPVLMVPSLYASRLSSSLFTTICDMVYLILTSNSIISQNPITQPVAYHESTERTL
ncbi:CPBP family intramembrane glutamic endopeptidase [Paenibacillus sp. NEAU-GSW1]|uniref:CPBP family intramembrane glutamic endopeptidase n=1 Tax=Paenibacillus sp. NEAU-GSW1 TaxID=2682486 RepID=UPI0020A639A4|nr:CPBP family intramembrane glutamic endopeptidase [Paenibacillus sp. NEAU-GSW1]